MVYNDNTFFGKLYKGFLIPGSQASLLDNDELNPRTIENPDHNQQKVINKKAKEIEQQLRSSLKTTELKKPMGSKTPVIVKEPIRMIQRGSITQSPKDSQGQEGRPSTTEHYFRSSQKFGSKEVFHFSDI